MRSFVLLLLVLQAILRPRNSLQAGRLDLSPTRDAPAVAPAFYPFQGIPHLYQRPRYEDIFLEDFRCALSGCGVIRRISDFCFSRIPRVVFQACHFLNKLSFFVEQPLFEVFGIHSILSIRIESRLLVFLETA